jgi:hypothetical protein
VQHDEHERHLRRRGIEAEEFFGDDDVGRAGDRKEFGETLDDGQEEDLQQRHRGILKE